MAIQKHHAQEIQEVREVPTVDEWRGCYNGSWQKLIVPEAFAHP